MPKKIIPLSILLLALLGLLMTPMVRAKDFDHNAWDILLKAHVLSKGQGKVTVVGYQGMAADRDKLKDYLDDLSSVSFQRFDRWSKDEQLAFLINAYNAWTVELILSAWPDLDSIKDLGGLFSSPWRKDFIPLLKEIRSLDNIEHGLIRGSGRYNDPRIHFAVNCASIGCPALRDEAYVAERLDRQLDQQTRLFLSDQSRNYVEDNTVMLSSLFKWYREDFTKGWLGSSRLEDFLLAYADSLGVDTTLAEKLRTGEAKIRFLPYDWKLNKK